MTPQPADSGEQTWITAFMILAGPSGLRSEAFRIAPTKTTGFFESTVSSRKKAPSAMVSVPWVTTTPFTSGSASSSLTLRASLRQISGVMWELSILQREKTLIRAALARSGTALIRSAPETAGTAAPVAGLIRSAIVPPVETIQTSGSSSAAGIADGRRNDTANKLTNNNLIINALSIFEFYINTWLINNQNN